MGSYSSEFFMKSVISRSMPGTQSETPDSDVIGAKGGCN